jgi:hypothetical protein
MRFARASNSLLPGNDPAVDRVVDRESGAPCAPRAFRDTCAAISAGSVPRAVCRASRNA